MKTAPQQIALTALFVAIICVCAIITVPFGPIPFTLLTFAITLTCYLLSPKNATFAFFIYLCIGALGLPVFSAMRGGFGVLLGPTGGFLWGYLIFIYPTTSIISKIKFKSTTINLASEFLLGFVLTIFAYTFGCLQYMFVANISIEIAFATAVLPFIAIDIAKIACALAISEVVKRQTNILDA